MIYTHTSPKPIGAQWFWLNDGHSQALSIWTFWYIWKARNEIIFHHQHFYPAVILKKTFQAIHEWNVATHLKEAITWVPPEVWGTPQQN